MLLGKFALGYILYLESDSAVEVGPRLHIHWGLVARSFSCPCRMLAFTYTPPSASSGNRIALCGDFANETDNSTPNGMWIGPFWML